MPRVSVCIPNYNYAEYLPQCIGSVLAQEFGDFELLVADDCSSDDSEAVVRGFDDPRISFVRNGERRGLVGNWNGCIERAQGEFILILHADDFLLPGMLGAEAGTLAAHPNAGMAFSAVKLTDAEGTPTQILKPFDEDRRWDAGEFVPVLLEENFIRTPSVMVRRECYARLGTFNPRLGFTPDWEMWLRIAAAYEVAYLATPYAAYREHTRNATLEFNRHVVDLQDQVTALDIFFAAHPGFEEDGVSAYAGVSARAHEQVLTCLREGDAEHAVGYARLAAALDGRIHGGEGDLTRATPEILARQGAKLGEAHRALEKWALELEAELKRRDAMPKRGASRLRKAIPGLR